VLDLPAHSVEGLAMKRSGFKRRLPPKSAAEAIIAKSKIVKKPLARAAKQQDKLDLHREGRCAYFFEEHGTHARQQCVRAAGHYGPHHCGGIRK
jgi:hypothetical protein